MLTITINVDWPQGFVAPRHLSIVIPERFYLDGVGKFLHGFLYGVYGLSPVSFSIEGVSNE